MERDAQALALLDGLGWGTITVWECGLKDMDQVAAALFSFLGPARI
ncbi:G:T-mismatch repair DNA endonuclease (very short patch repair protein) [Arthrobacter silviterrae]|nr:hypothetical protein [Arthrobacter silviterrae]MDQ0278044.1 G:T-mismatch repair DNA endonuclease (very short patch repair protein) [Arthrobacter silviterrae]